ncbi:DUF2316 family protein [Fructilactobacillus vespulae]|uniref:DUF2316 family protein n=1 Tax=Fructilactobacillus vespulae TaxID=1249630 RepID=UPI0039B6A7E9
MSLNRKEQINTKEELKANFDLSELTMDEIAGDLGTTKQHLADVFALNSKRIEEPWILRDYLNDKIIKSGKKPIPYTKLVGSPANYFFLDLEFIQKGILLK